MLTQLETALGAMIGETKTVAKDVEALPKEVVTDVAKVAGVIAKGFDDIVEDAASTSAEFKTLRDSKFAEADAYQQQITALNAQIASLQAQIEAATGVANQADQTATALDQVIAAARPAAQNTTESQTPVAQTAQPATPPAQPTAQPAAHQPA